MAISSPATTTGKPGVPTSNGQLTTEDVSKYNIKPSVLPVEEVAPVRDSIPSQAAQSAQAMCLMQSKEQKALLDAIDELRRCGIDEDIAIPQIVVCGDQSSGKSAVLSALSRMPFESGPGMVTCFTTEVVMRRGPKVSMTARVDPGSFRTTEERKKLAFKQTGTDVDDFRSMYEAASNVIRSMTQPGVIVNDTLHIEITGPDQLHLTLVDLPGIIQHNPKVFTQNDGGVSGKSNGTSKDLPYDSVAAIKAIVEHYLRKELTIVLAITTATHDIVNQSVFSMIETCNARSRSLGVITKPDRIEAASDQKKWITIANNETVPLGHGWHVVCNLHHEDMLEPNVDRDANEEKVLSSGRWADLDRDICGIVNLQQRLRDLLLEAIQSELPSLQRKLRSKQDTYARQLEKYGPARDTLPLRKQYLLQVGNGIANLLKIAAHGNYETSDFAKFFSIKHEYRLRDEIRSLLDGFAKALRSKKAYTILPPIPKTKFFGSVEDNQGKGSTTNLKTAGPPFGSPPPATKTVFISPGSETKTLNVFCDEIAIYLDKNRGCEPDNITSSSVAYRCFHEQSSHWRLYGLQCIEECERLVWQVVKAALHATADKYTADVLWVQLVAPVVEELRVVLRAKLDEVLWPYEKSFMIARRPDYLSKVMRSSTTADARTWYAQAVEAGFSNQGCKAAASLDFAEAYYEVALDTFVENLSNLAIERLLLSDLPNIINSTDLACAEDEDIDLLGAEPKDVATKRNKLVKQIEVCQEVLKTCLRYGTGIPHSQSDK